MITVLLVYANGQRRYTLVDDFRHGGPDGPKSGPLIGYVRDAKNNMVEKLREEGTNVVTCSIFVPGGECAIRIK